MKSSVSKGERRLGQNAIGRELRRARHRDHAVAFAAGEAGCLPRDRETRGDQAEFSIMGAVNVAASSSTSSPAQALSAAAQT